MSAMLIRPARQYAVWSDRRETIRLRPHPKLSAGISSPPLCRQSAPADKSFPLASLRMTHLLFERCKSGKQHHQSFVLCFDLIFLRFELRLLLLDLILLARDL